MREFEYNEINNELLKKGIRPFEEGILNAPLAEELYDVKCGSSRLVPFIPLETFEIVEELSDWPFPHYLHGVEDAFVSSVVAGDMVISRITGVGESEVVETKEAILVEMASLPDIADFESFLVIMGSFGIIYGSPGDYYTSSEVALDDTPLGLTCCNFKGQLIIGNIISSWYGCGSGHVVWSEIGNINCHPSESNIAGYMSAGVGEVYQVRRIGDQIVVYGSTGITSLLPYQEPAATFGLQEIADFGLASRQAVAGSLEEHLLIGSNGTFYRLGVDRRVDRLEYQTISDRLSLPNVKMSYDTIRQEYFITDGERCFLLTKFGMSEVYQLVACVIPIAGTPYGIMSTENPWFSLTTGPIDFHQRGLKTLMLVELDVDGCIVDVEIRGGGGEWEVYKSIVANEFNVATIMATAQEFRVTIRKNSFADVYPSYIKIRYKMTDLRMIRGQYE